MGNVITTSLMFLALVGMICLLGLVLAFPVMWLWNYAMPVATGAGVIGYWHAWCLLVLSSLLVKSASSSS